VSGATVWRSLSGWLAAQLPCVTAPLMMLVTLRCMRTPRPLMNYAQNDERWCRMVETLGGL
jgi:hypothetical protein